MGLKSLRDSEEFKVKSVEFRVLRTAILFDRGRAEKHKFLTLNSQFSTVFASQKNSAPIVASLMKGRKNMYAVIETGGKQYKVAEGDVLYIEKLGVDESAEVTFDKVLAVSTDKGFKAGKDCAKASVKAKVLKNGKGKKITVFTYKPKKNEKRKMGHRQPYTKVEITSIKA